MRSRPANRENHLGLDQVTPTGDLPMELSRGSRALEYHLFALAPLATLDLMGRANGVDLDEENSDALGRLVQFWADDRDPNDAD